jgi:ABC-type transport system involved in multi-copper enzyme maturation permease subunit
VITLVHAELLKLRTTRLWIVLLVASVAVVGLIVIAVLASNPGPNTDPQDRGLHDLTLVADVRMLLDIGGIAAPLALVLGATMTTSEYRYGTAGVTYLATPRRARVVTAKMLAAVPVGALFGVLGASVPVLVALAWFATKGHSVPLDHTIPLEILQLGLQAMFGAVMGVAVGAVVRNQVAAIVGLLVWGLVVENIVGALIPVTAKWFPFNGAASAFSYQASDHLFGRPEAGLLMAGYVVLGWAAAVWFERHRDV